MMKFSWLLLFFVGLWQIQPVSPVDNIIEHPTISELVNAADAEIFQSVPLHRYQMEGKDVCASGVCEQVYIYDFAHNATIVAVVADGQLLDALRIENATPAFNERVERLAQKMIAESAMVQEAVGEIEESTEIVIMQMQHPSCLSDHLCVATTLLADGGSVWVLVDVTEEQIIDLWWGDVAADGEQAADVVREEPFFDCAPHSLERDGWHLEYRITPSDGFAVADVYYGSKQVVSDVRLVQWEANYVNDGNYAYTDYAGCGAQGPGHGFPIDPVGRTKIESVRGGFAIKQDFQMSLWGEFCNYRYEQTYEFYRDGRWRVISTPFGRGCGDGRYKEATYRPIFRIEFALDGTGNDFFQSWDGNDWQQHDSEAYFLPDTHVNSDKHAFRISDNNGMAYTMEMGQGQFVDGGKNDDAYTYLTRYKAEEGAADMPTIGTCCHQNYEQPPFEFVDGENTAGEHLVIWYVPQALTVTKFAVEQGVANEPYCWTESTLEYYPCPMGPMFHPVQPELAVGLKSADNITTQNTPLFIITVSLLFLTGFYYYKQHTSGTPR